VRPVVPADTLPVGFGQVRKLTQLPMLTMVTGYAIPDRTSDPSVCGRVVESQDRHTAHSLTINLRQRQAASWARSAACVAAG
jgi:hypothetical protein